MARKNGCPMSLQDWQLEILSRASDKENPEWLPVRGLSAFELSLEADTSDGSGADSLWSEPYVTKRSGTLTLTGRPRADAATSETDRGLSELNYCAALGGCAGDTSIRLTDPYGCARIIDVVVVEVTAKAEAEGESLSYECEIVGAPEEIPFVQLTGVALNPPDALSLAVNEQRELALLFTPAGASNRRFSAFSADPAKVRVQAGDGRITITGLAPTGGTVAVTVRSMNNRLTASVPVTVV